MTNLCKACAPSENLYLSKVYRDSVTKEVMAVCSNCKEVFQTTFEPTKEQNFLGHLDEKEEQKQIESLLVGCPFKYPPHADDHDTILAYRMLTEDGHEPTDKEEFYSMYNVIMSNSVHLFETDNLEELLQDPDAVYYDFGFGFDDDPIEWAGINIDLRYLYLINGTFFYFVG